MRSNLLALLLAAAPAAAAANGYSVPNVNPRDLGLAGSAVAAQRDAAAVYANPAALARLGEGLQLAVAGSLVNIHQDWSAPTGPASEKTKLKLAPPAGAFLAYGTTLRGTPWGFGVGFNVPFGGNVFWKDDWEGRTRVVTVDRKVYAFYGNAAFQAGPYLRIGGGLVYYRTTEYLTQALDYLRSEGYGELSAEGGKLTYQVAVELQPLESLRLGFDYKHKATQYLRGDAAFHGVPAELRPRLNDQGLEHQLTIPNVLHVAAAWQAHRDVLVTAAYTWDRYEVYAEDYFRGSSVQVYVPRNYRNGYTVRAGIEYRLLPTIEVRVGGLRDRSGGSSATYSPSLPDADAWAATVGASWRFHPTMTVDAGFFKAWMDRVTATGSAFAGSYDIGAEVYSLGLTWRPGR